MRESMYIPSEQDKAWMQQMVRCIRPGGNWGCPATMSVFQFNHADKEIILISGDPENETNRRTVSTAKAIGWRVLTQAEKTKELNRGK